ncbi:MAG: type I methionyl aminopeptidase [Synergistaceae bacterium]|jgi:methionyl aminopeptidase|nr:type I methionyl aminopeptidase [Synergistaceae bacterium]
MITLKKPDEIKKMKRAGRIVADVLILMSDLIKPGVDTLSLDEAAEDLIVRAGAKAAFKGYRQLGIQKPFPGSICVSINEEVVHGFPDRKRILQEGDIVSIDVGAVIDGYYGDAARTLPVGEITPSRQSLLDVTYKALHVGMEQAVPGKTIGDIGHAIETWVLGNGCGLVRDYAGHGIGRRLHEAPQVPNHGRPKNGLTLKSGMTFCIEPMVMSGAEQVRSLSDGWTVVTEDSSDAAHFEHSLLVTEDGAEILTPWE